jgi:Zn-dependent M28 family amino/carboxypeptidase
VTVSNTVGEIRGAETPDEVVLCGAHLDSWDLGEGTVDNGTGSMVVLETARLLKALGVRPARTIRFVLFYGEEEGLVGSAEYVQRHKAEMPRLSAVFVNDTGTGRVTGIGLHGNPQLRPIFETEWPILKELGVTGYNTFLMGGTDHASFAPTGVPSCWFSQASGDYGLMHHSQSDTFDKALPDDLKQCASVMAICAYNTAQLPTLLPRKTP